jgi:hypothetical protein
MAFTPEESEKAIQEKVDLMKDIGMVDQAKQQIAATGLIMECCLVMARDIVERRYNLSDEDDIQKLAFQMFEALMIKFTPAPQQQQKVIPIDPALFRNIPKV